MTGQRVDVADSWTPIVGTPAAVAAAVRAARASGRLESMTRPKLVPDGSGRAYIHIRLRDEPPLPVRRWPVVVAGGVVLAASGTATVLAVAWVVDHWAQILGAGLVALVLVAVHGRVRR